MIADRDRRPTANRARARQLPSGIRRRRHRPYPWIRSSPSDGTAAMPRNAWYRVRRRSSSSVKLRKKRAPPSPLSHSNHRAGHRPHTHPLRHQHDRRHRRHPTRHTPADPRHRRRPPGTRPSPRHQRPPRHPRCLPQNAHPHPPLRPRRTRPRPTPPDPSSASPSTSDPSSATPTRSATPSP